MEWQEVLVSQISNLENGKFAKTVMKKPSSGYIK